MIYLCGTIMIALLGFVSTMVLTRILSQKVYAMYGLLVTFVSAVDMFIAMGYDQAYMRFYYAHDRSAGRFLWECMKVPLMMFLVFAVVFLEPGQRLIQFVFAERLTWIAVCAVLAKVFLSNAHRFGQLIARMSESAGNYVISNIISKSGFLGIVLILSLVIGDISFAWIGISFAITAALATAINLAAFRRIYHRKNPEGKRIAGMDLLKYGFPYMINNVLVLLIPILEKIIIRNLAGWEVLSIFTAASIFQTVVLLVLNTITNIWNPLVFKHCEDEKTFKPIIHTFGLVTTLVLTCVTSACILLRRWLVLLLDEKYFTVYVIAPTIMVAACFNILAAIYAVGINIRKKTIHLVVAPIIQIIISMGLCYLLIPSLGLIGVGIAILASIATARGYRIMVGLHYYDTGVKETKVLVVCILCAVATVASMFFTSLAHDVLISVTLFALTCLIINKDILTVTKYIITLVKPTPKREKHN